MNTTLVDYPLPPVPTGKFDSEHAFEIIETRPLWQFKISTKKLNRTNFETWKLDFFSWIDSVDICIKHYMLGLISYQPVQIDESLGDFYEGVGKKEMKSIAFSCECILRDALYYNMCSELQNYRGRMPFHECWISLVTEKSWVLFDREIRELRVLSRSLTDVEAYFFYRNFYGNKPTDWKLEIVSRTVDVAKLDDKCLREMLNLIASRGFDKVYNEVVSSSDDEKNDQLTQLYRDLSTYITNILAMRQTYETTINASKPSFQKVIGRPAWPSTKTRQKLSKFRVQPYQIRNHGSPPAGTGADILHVPSRCVINY